MALAARLRTRRAWLANAWISAALLIGVVVAANRLAKEHLRLSLDLSEEQLFAPSPVAAELFDGLDDVLQVKAFFTSELKHGPVQLAKNRLLDQLREYEDAAHGRMELVFADPNSSTEVRLEAQGYGIEPIPLRAVQGTSELTQEVFLGLVMRYRGREAVLPFVLPQSFSYGLLSELSRLQREEELVVGLIAGGPGLAGADDFQQARRLLEAGHRLVELDDLADGASVPADTGLVIVARPVDLHPREAFALDQYVQGGGRLLILAERVRIDLAGLEARLIDTGLEQLLAAWGVPVTSDLIWDQEANWLSIADVGRTQYPFWVNVGEAGMERSVPVTGRLSGADLFWTHPVGEQPVAGLVRTALVRSSQTSWAVAADEALAVGGESLNTRGVELLAAEPSAARDLVVALSGRFPSPFAAGAPAPRDALSESLWREAVRSALEAGTEPPARAVEFTDEPVASGAAGGEVVVVGDADWISDGKFFTARNQLLFENLVDWLLLSDDLIALRATLPRERRIKDFLVEQRLARGLPALRGTGGMAVEADPALVGEAEAAARRARTLHMLSATVGALALASLMALGLRRILAGGMA